jgi:hypothetical protein
MSAPLPDHRDAAQQGLLGVETQGVGVGDGDGEAMGGVGEGLAVGDAFGEGDAFGLGAAAGRTLLSSES